MQEWEEEWAKEEEYFSESSQTMEEATEGRRSSRRRNKPLLYQSEVEVVKERDAKEKQRHRSSSSRTDVIPKAEEERHDWKEGERIGEASNPGPRLFRNHAPERTTKREKAPAGQRGVRAVLQACAGEFTKGINPAPPPATTNQGIVPLAPTSVTIFHPP